MKFIEEYLHDQKMIIMEKKNLPIKTLKTNFTSGTQTPSPYLFSEKSYFTTNSIMIMIKRYLSLELKSYLSLELKSSINAAVHNQLHHRQEIKSYFLFDSTHGKK
jgi:hypothetical protein